MAQTKTMASIRSLALISTAALMIMSAASSADTSNPFVGTWVLDIAKSTFDPPPPLKSHHVAITAEPEGKFHNSIDIVEGDGTRTHLEFTTALDGKAVPVTGYPYADSVRVSQVGPRTQKEVFLKGGKAVETGSFTVSADGKTMQGPISGTDGKVSWKYHYIFDRQ
jgi:hypothetical protein